MKLESELGVTMHIQNPNQTVHMSAQEDDLLF